MNSVLDYIDIDAVSSDETILYQMSAGQRFQ